MDSQKLGSEFETITRDFFMWLFNQIDLTITKVRVQKSGTQDGFDIQFQISKNLILHNVYIECKNYSSGIDLGHIFQKALELETNYPLNNSNDLFIAINSKSNFKNKDNPEKTKRTFNDKFDFQCQLLDVSNGIKEIFALNPHFYKKLYGEEPDFEIDEKKIIDKFKNIIFANEPFKKVLLKEEDKINFLTEINTQNFFINRYLSKNQNNYDYLLNRDTQYRLEDIVNDNDKVLILGNPGSGKTTLLKEFSIRNWNVGEQNSATPIYRNLKNFTILDTIEDKLPQNYEKLKNILLILDGVDEIADTEDFISKLEEFLKTELIRKNKVKCVLSCRTNIYESVIKNISEFSTFFINDLNLDESKSLLGEYCNSSITNLPLYTISDSFLKNPFQVKILATYININNRLPTNSAILWKTYIDERLKIDAVEKQKKKKFNSTLVKRQSLKVSLINELMKSSRISEEQLLKIFNNIPEHLNEFKKNPLLEIISGTEDWCYEHKNIQEYFAAKLISEKSIKDIISFIQILDKKKTHPSLFNSITFLINLLDKNSEKYSKLIDWLVENEPEILFKADYDRISEELKIKIFQTYFNKICIEKTLWIDNNRTYLSREIALFASCTANFDYLIAIIKEPKSHHRRTVLSALDLLKYFKVAPHKNNELKKILIKSLKAKNLDASLKAEMVALIYNRRFTKNDKEYLKAIFNCFRTSTHKELNRSLMNLLLELDNVEEFYWFIKEEFLLLNRLKERKIRDEVVRGGKYVINQLILKIKDSYKFLDIVQHFIFEDTFDYIYKKQEILNNIKDRVISYIEQDENYIIELLSRIRKDYNFYSRDTLLLKIIIETNSNKRVIEFLLNSFESNKVRSFISRIINEESIGFVCDKLIELKTEHQEIEYWRNNIGHSVDRKLSVKFHNFMKKRGVVFKEEVLTPSKAEKNRIKYKTHFQENFNLLFDKVKLQSKIKYLFTKYGKQIDGERIIEIKNEWNNKNGFWNTIDIQIDILEHIIFSLNKKPISFKEVVVFLKDDFVLFRRIKMILERNRTINRELKIYDSHKEMIINWSIEQTDKIDFNNVVKASGLNSFYILNDYRKIEMIFYYQALFDIELPKDFLLNCVRFHEFSKSNDSDEDFIKLKKLINDNSAFNKRIISNIQSGELLGFSKLKHIKYAIDNNITTVFDEVREYLKSKNSLYSKNNMLKKYISITRDYDLLKECSVDLKDYKAWISIDILIDFEKESEFCIQKALNYLNLDEVNYRENAIQTLFRLNYKGALKCLIKLLEKNVILNFGYVNFNKFKNVEDMKELKTFFHLVYKPEFDKYESHHYRNFFNYLITIFSTKEETFEKIQSILNEIKDDLLNKEKDLFYINNLIESSLNSYINSKSSIYTLDKALKIVNTLE